MTSAVSYSTLEVALNQPPAHPSSLDTAYNTPASHSNGLHPVEQDTPKYTVDDPESTYTTRDPRENPIEAKRIFGITRRTLYWYILPATALLVVGAIAGGVAGGLLSRHNQQDANLISILPTSQLAASNFTTVDGVAYLRTVFFQDSHNALIARRFNMTTKTWQTSNISSTLITTAQQLNILPGTPLASAACIDWSCGNVRTYFLTSNNTINAVEDYSITTGGWTQTAMVNQANITTWPGSKLAAAWNAHFETYNDGNFAVAYQDRNGYVTIANDSNLASPAQITSLSPAVSKASLAMVPQSQWYNNSYVLSRMSLVTELGVSSTTASMQKSNYGDSHWDIGETIMREIPVTSEAEAFAITTLNGWHDTLYLALLPNGTITGRVIGDHNRTIPSISLLGGPAVNFSTIATTHDAMLYGIWNDSILEYTFDQSDPSILNYVGIIYP